MLLIDGSYGEGGGQILRTSVSLAALTGRGIQIVNIRAGRPKPGLQPQHLMAVRAAAGLCNAELQGAAVGSTQLRFAPRSPVRSDSYAFDIGTAGATALVAQTVLLPLAHADGRSEVTITGGTHVPHAPCADYLETVYLPALRRLGFQGSARYDRAGYYPKGGGRLDLRIDAWRPDAGFDMTERGKLLKLTAYIVTSELPEHVAERGGAQAERFMKSIGRPLRVERREKPAMGAGAAVLIVAECENGIAGFSSLGQRGKPMERVTDEACEAFLAWWQTGAACDEHLGDQLVLPAVLLTGPSRWRPPAVTEHLRTVLWVAEQFLPIRTAIEETEGAPPLITVEPAE